MLGSLLHTLLQALVIDWHNYGYTIMQSTGAPVPLIKLASLFERVLVCVCVCVCACVCV